MKKLMMAALLLISFSAFAQDYLVEDSEETRNLVLQKPIEGFNLCQWNQDLLYQRALVDSNEQLVYLIQAIEEEKAYSLKSFRLQSYFELLREQIFHHILIDQMRKQLGRRTLFSRYTTANQKLTATVLEIEGVKFELSEEISETLNNIADYRNMKEGAIDLIKEELYTETLTSLAKGTLSGLISSSTRAAVMKFIAGKVTKEVFKKAIVSTGVEMGSEILVSAGRTSLLTALTFPLHAYRLSDEDVWLDLADKAPALLLNPGWRNQVNNSSKDALAWQTHCRTINWRPKDVERIFNKLLEREKAAYYSKVQAIMSMQDFNNSRSYLILEQKKDATYIKPIYPRKVPL